MEKAKHAFSVHSEQPAVEAALDAGFAFAMEPCRDDPQQASQESGAFSPVSSPPFQPRSPQLLKWRFCAHPPDLFFWQMKK